MIIPLLENVVRKIRRALYIRTPDPVREQMRIGADWPIDVQL